MPAPSANILSRAWTTVRSWFEIPYGYEDENGFHYGDEPVTCRSDANSLREVFTDRASDTAMFMAATSTETSPKTQQEALREKPQLVINPS